MMLDSWWSTKNLCKSSFRKLFTMTAATLGMLETAIPNPFKVGEESVKTDAKLLVLMSVISLSQLSTAMTWTKPKAWRVPSSTEMLWLTNTTNFSNVTWYLMKGKVAYILLYHFIEILSCLVARNKNIIEIKYDLIFLFQVSLSIPLKTLTIFSDWLWQKDFITHIYYMPTDTW